MEIDNYPSNSKMKPARPEEKIEEVQRKKPSKVISGSSRKRANSGLRKFVNALFSLDDAVNMSDYILYDVLVPSFRRTVVDTVESFFGVRGLHDSYNDSPRRVRRFDYSNPQSSTRQQRSERQPRRIEFDDIVLTRRSDAEEVLSSMQDLIETYGLVSIADYYDLCGETASYTDNKYGWTDIRSARVEDTGGGYVIRFPRAVPL